MGLHNREYMRSPYPEPGNNGHQMMFTLIIINIISFFLFKGNSTVLFMDGTFRWINILQIISAGFIHYDFWHLFFNMWGLYIFGKLVTPYMTKQNFLLLYLSGIVCGNLIFMLTHLHTPGVMLGSSGAICAVMVAAAMLEPERRFVMLFLPFSPLKTTTLVICYTVLEILMLIGKTGSGIAHLTQLAGFAGGYILMKLLYRNRLPWDPLRFVKMPSMPKFTPPPAGNKSSGNSADAPVSQRELDDLLDKLSRDGINSLSAHELERLKKARRQMRGEE